MALTAALMMCATGCSEFSGTLKANANIAFMGDSITNFWPLPTTNYGVPGNTTSQMLVRFPTEVLGHGYRAVVILGGTNDMARAAIPPPQSAINLAIANLEQMASLAENDGMEVVLCTIPPIADSGTRVVELNVAIESLASTHRYKLADYYTPMIGHPEYFKDNLHPDTEGYVVMQSVLSKEISLNY